MQICIRLGRFSECWPKLMPSKSLIEKASQMYWSYYKEQRGLNLSTTLIHWWGKLFLTLLTTRRVCTSEQGHGRPHLGERGSKTAKLELEDQLSRHHLWSSNRSSKRIPGDVTSSNQPPAWSAPCYKNKY